MAIKGTSNGLEPPETSFTLPISRLQNNGHLWLVNKSLI